MECCGTLKFRVSVKNRTMRLNSWKHHSATARTAYAASANKGLWGIAVTGDVRHVVDLYTNLGLASFGERDLHLGRLPVQFLLVSMRLLEIGEVTIQDPALVQGFVGGAPI